VLYTVILPLFNYNLLQGERDTVYSVKKKNSIYQFDDGIEENII